MTYLHVGRYDRIRWYWAEDGVFESWVLTSWQISQPELRMGGYQPELRMGGYAMTLKASSEKQKNQNNIRLPSNWFLVK